jgi:hypothetical protein
LGQFVQQFSGSWPETQVTWFPESAYCNPH